MSDARTQGADGGERRRRTWSADLLGWPEKFVAGSPGGPTFPPELTVTVPEHETLLSPDMALLWNGPASNGVVAQTLVMLNPTLDADVRNQFAGKWEASPHQRLERLMRETNVGVGVLVARNKLRLIYAPRGETAGWLSWLQAALNLPLKPESRVLVVSSGAAENGSPMSAPSACSPFIAKYANGVSEKKDLGIRFLWRSCRSRWSSAPGSAMPAPTPTRKPWA
jgi:hypothetical protein